MFGKKAGLSRARITACVILALVALGATNAGRARAAMTAYTAFELFSFQKPGISDAKAGGHPDVDVIYIVANASGETLKSVVFAPNAGFTFEPASVSSCTNTKFAGGECSPDAQLGIVTVDGEHEGNRFYPRGTVPVYNLSPVSGEFARIGFHTPTIEQPVIAVASLPTEPQPPDIDSYQLRFSIDQLPQASPPNSINMVLWGVPASSGHDPERFPQGSPGCPGSETTSCNTPTASSLPEAPYTLAAVYCEPGSPFLNWTPVKRYATYEGYEKEGTDSVFENGDCEALSFNPGLSAAPPAASGYSSAGLDVVVTDPQPQTPGTVSPSELRSASITARGVTLDPSISEHPVCPDSAAAITGNRPSACPPSTKIGTAIFDIKGLPDKLYGEIFLGSPVTGRPRVFVVAPSNDLTLKQVGLIDRLIPDGLKFTFDDQPRLPITEESFHFLPGFVRTPVHCGSYAVEGHLVPWAPNQPVREPTTTYSISTGPGGASCIGEPETVAVRLEPPSIAADGSSQTTVTVAVHDAEGNGVPAEDVQLSSSDPSQEIGEVLDHGDGTYNTTVTGSKTVGSSTITATDVSAEPQLSGSAELTQTGGSLPNPAPEGTPPTAPRLPTVRWLGKPPRYGRSRRVRFDFAADVADATFACSLDHHRYRTCAPPVVLRKLGVGRHAFSVRAAIGPALGAASSWQFRIARRGHR
jgi:hypothetical protein